MKHQLTELASQLTDKNYSSITGKIQDELINNNFSFVDCGSTLGPTTISWELWKSEKGEQVKIRTTIHPSGKVTIVIF